MKHSCHHTRGSESWGKLGDGKGHRFIRKCGGRVLLAGVCISPTLHLQYVVSKTGNNNNTPAPGESIKRRILCFENLLLRRFLLLLLTPVFRSVWGPFCLSMMSYLVRVVAICQDMHTDTPNTRTHTDTHSLFHLSPSERGSIPLFWFFVAVTDLRFEAHIS